MLLIRDRPCCYCICRGDWIGGKGWERGRNGRVGGSSGGGGGRIHSL